MRLTGSTFWLGSCGVTLALLAGCLRQDPPDAGGRTPSSSLATDDAAKLAQEPTDAGGRIPSSFLASDDTAKLAQEPRDADNIIPLTSSIEEYHNAQVSLGQGQNVQVYIPYCLSGNSTLIVFPVWLVGEQVHIWDGKEWKLLNPHDEVPPLISGQPVRLRFLLRNLLSSEEGRRAVYDLIRKRVAELRGLKGDQLRLYEPRLDKERFRLTVFVPRSGERPDPPVSLPVRLSETLFSEPHGQFVEVPLDSASLVELRQQMSGQPLRLMDLRLRIEGPFQSRMEQLQLLGSVKFVQTRLADLQNQLRPKAIPNAPSPSLLIVPPVATGGHAQQRSKIRDLLVQTLEVQILTRQDSQHHPGVIYLMQRLLDHALTQAKLSDEQDNKVVTVLLSQQAALTATVGELRKISLKDRKEREAVLNTLLDNWEAEQSGKRRAGQVNLQAEFRTLGIGFRGAVAASAEESAQQARAQWRKEQLETLHRCLDDLSNHFEGRLQFLTGISLEQKNLLDVGRNLEAEIKQGIFTIGWAEYRWPGMSPSFSAGEVLLKIRKEAQELSLRQQQLEQARKTLEDTISRAQGLNKELAEARQELDRIAAKLRQLDKELDQNDLRSLRKELGECRDLLNRLSTRLSHLEARTISSKLDVGSPVLSVAVTPDGKYVVSGSEDKTVRVWELATGKEVRRFMGHRSGVNRVAVTPDGQYVVSGSHDETVRLWELATGKEVRPFTGHKNWVSSVAVTPDGKYIVSGSWDNTVRLWELATGQEVRQFTGHESWVRSVAVTPDGQYVVSGSDDKTVRLWELATGKEVRRFTGHEDWVHSVAVTPDGKYVVSGSHDKTVRLWELATGQEVRRFTGHERPVYSVALTPDGKYVVSGSGDKTVRVWDLATGQEVRQFTGHERWVNSVAVTPDGKYVVSGSGQSSFFSNPDNTVRVWYIGDLPTPGK
jgi:DNA-binding beta-propeller fold protein YncE